MNVFTFALWGYVIKPKSANAFGLFSGTVVTSADFLLTLQ